MVSNILIPINIDYYYEFFDETIEFKSKNIHLKSLTHIQYEKSFQNIILMKIQLSSP